MKEPEELKYKKKLFQGSTSHFQSRLGGAHSFKAENVWKDMINSYLCSSNQFLKLLFALLIKCQNYLAG